MCQLQINIPDAVLADTRMNRAEAEVFTRRLLAMSYYTKYGVSVGYCAQIAGMREEDFVSLLSENGISVFHFDSEAEFDEELANA